MAANDVLALGLAITRARKLAGQRLETDRRPKTLHIDVAAIRGSLFACAECDGVCKVYDFATLTRHHLDVF